MFIAERISAKQHNPGCILAVVYVCTCPSRLGMSNVTLRNINVMLRNVNLLRLGINLLRAFYRVCQLRPVHAEDDFSAGKRLHWSENSGAFMEGSEESCSSGHGPREAGPAHAHWYYEH